MTCQEKRVTWLLTIWQITFLPLFIADYKNNHNFATGSPHKRRAEETAVSVFYKAGALVWGNLNGT